MLDSTESGQSVPHSTIPLCLVQLFKNVTPITYVSIYIVFSLDNSKLTLSSTPILIVQAAQRHNELAIASTPRGDLLAT